MTKEGQRTIALLYSHKDREYLQRSGSTKTTVLVDQLSALAESLAGFELWWDDKTLENRFDEEILDRIDQAEVIILLVSASFVISDYVKKKELPRVAKRLDGPRPPIVVRIDIEQTNFGRHGWLAKLNSATDAPLYLAKRREARRTEQAFEIAEHLRKRMAKRFELRDASEEDIGKQPGRRRPEQKLSLEERSAYQDEASLKAIRMVPDEAIRDCMVRRAKRMLRGYSGRKLTASDLEIIDQKCSKPTRRKPDAKFARWVLRAHGLHPQARASSHWEPRL